MTADRALQTLRLLSSGLVHAHSKGLVQLAPHAPYNAALQRAANRLTLDLLLMSRRPPQDLPELLALCHHPLAEWDLPLPEHARYGQLLVEGIPSDTCQTWAIAGNQPEWELAAQALPEIRDVCMIRNRPDWYSAARRALIEAPVLTPATEGKWHRQEPMAVLQEHLAAIYEPVPGHLAKDGEIWFCGYCGWTLEQVHTPRWRCGDDLCASLKGDLGATAVRRPAREVTRRLRAPLRRFLLLPGIPELAMGKWLEERGVAVTYWPDYDRCDLRCTFPDGSVWEVDVKDWAVPFALAEAIQAQPPRPSTDCQRYLYVVPDHRERLFPGYERVLRTLLPHGTYQVHLVRRFKRMVQQHLKGGARDA